MPDDSFQIIIEGREIVVESAKFLLTMNTGADALTAVMPWQPGLDPDLDDITSPYGYQEAEIYIGGTLQMIGRLYNVEHTTNGEGTTKELEVFSKTADIIDSTVIPPFEANRIGLLERCKQQCEDFGIEVKTTPDVKLLKPRTVPIRRLMTARERRSYEKSVLSQFKTTFPVEPIKQAYLSSGELPKNKIAGGYKITVGRKTIYEEIKFARVSAEQTETIFFHLSKLAALRGYLLSCTRESDLLITKANVDGNPVGTIEEGEPLTDSYNARFDGRNRFSMYRAIASSSRSKQAAKTGTAEDRVVSVARYLTFRAGSNLPGQAGNAAEWRKNKVAADSMPTSFPVNSIYAPNGKLWEPNTLVTVVSPTLGIKKGFTFLITQVEFDYTSAGITANLQLKPPSVYRTGAIIEPWLE